MHTLEHLYTTFTHECRHIPDIPEACVQSARFVCTEPTRTPTQPSTYVCMQACMCICMYVVVGSQVHLYNECLDSWWRRLTVSRLRIGVALPLTCFAVCICVCVVLKCAHICLQFAVRTQWVCARHILLPIAVFAVVQQWPNFRFLSPMCLP